MNIASVKLTVFFEEPFWVGVFERVEDGRLSVCRVVFGAQPSDGEVYAFVLREYGRLRFSPAVPAEQRKQAENPKRAQRAARRMVSGAGIGTRSQQALQLQREQHKIQRAVRNRAQIEAEKERRFALKQQKQKQKHRGR